MAGKKDAAVARIAAGRYWREADAGVVVEGWRQSGETVSEFAGRYGLVPGRLRRWAKRLEEDGEPETSEPVRWHPVRVEGTADPAEATGRGPLEIVLGEGCSVRVPAGFAAEDLERVLLVLAAVA